MDTEKHWLIVWLYMAALNIPAFVRQAEIDKLRADLQASEKY